MLAVCLSSEQQLDTGLSDDHRGEEVAGHTRGGPSPHITSKICTFGMLFGKRNQVHFRILTKLYVNDNVTVAKQAFPDGW